jgi:hypothetical protein
MDQTTDAQAKARGQALMTQLDQQQNKNAMDLNNYRLEQAKGKLGLAQGSEAFGMQKLQDQIAKNALAGQLAVSKGVALEHLAPEVQQAYVNSLPNKVGGPDGSLGSASTPEAAKGFLDEAQPAQEIQQTLTDIKRARASGVIKNQAALQTFTDALKQQVGKLGDVKESQRTDELIQDMVGHFDQYFGLRPSADLDSRVRGLQHVATDRIKSAATRHQINWLKPPPSLNSAAISRQANELGAVPNG